MNYKLLESITLLFWDQGANFNKATTQQKIGKELFKDVIRIDSLDKLKLILERTENENQKFLFFVHLFHNDNNKGYYLFKSSKILKEFPNLNTYLISSAPKRTIYEGGNNELDVYSYDNFHEKIGVTFKAQTKSEIMAKLDSNATGISQQININPYPQFDYAIIAALYEDEFQEIEKVFNWDETQDIITETKRYRVGYLKNNKKKRIVAAVPNATGMVDSAIIATQMLDFFRPKYLLMSGVCGGNASTKFGDIVLAKKVFTIQKGKLSDLRNKKGELIELFDINKKRINPEQLFDQNGKQLSLSVEKFEIEHDSIIEIDPLVKDILDPKLAEIKNEINKTLSPYGANIQIYFEAMACSSMVINKTGFFENNIKTIDRKTVAVEMESYGVARATKFANNGKTKFLIFKSVMDNTVDKDDKAKRLAAYTSAQFLKHLIYNGVLR